MIAATVVSGFSALSVSALISYYYSTIVTCCTTSAWSDSDLFKAYGADRLIPGWASTGLVLLTLLTKTALTTAAVCIVVKLCAIMKTDYRGQVLNKNYSSLSSQTTSKRSRKIIAWIVIFVRLRIVSQMLIQKSRSVYALQKVKKLMKTSDYIS